MPEPYNTVDSDDIMVTKRESYYSKNKIHLLDNIRSIWDDTNDIPSDDDMSLSFFFN